MMIRPAPHAVFGPGDPVRVLDLKREGHVRTPGYVRGKRGRISSILGAFPNPESLAYGGDGLPEQTLYRVTFSQADLWDSYTGPPGDELVLDVYEHWLEPAGGRGG